MTEHYEIRKAGNVSTGAIPTREFKTHPTLMKKTSRTQHDGSRKPSNTGL